MGMLSHKNLENGTTSRVSNIDNQTHLEKLANSIDALTQRIDQFMLYSQNSMPNKVVYVIFLLVFGMIFGIQSLQFLFKSWLPQILGQ